MGFQIAIDGPSGSGKSSVARALTAELGFIYIDTGAMYRTVGLYALRQGIDPADEEAVTAALSHIRIRAVCENAVQQIYLEGEDVTDAIRTQAVADASSKVAVMPAVREKLVELQRALARDHQVIMDGRDIGTHVLPGADVKIYLDASPDTRAQRRCRELDGLQLPYDFDTIKRETIARDHNDMNRRHSPLRKAQDAIVMDTSKMSFDQVKSSILAMVRQKLEERGQ